MPSLWSVVVTLAIVVSFCTDSLYGLMVGFVIIHIKSTWVLYESYKEELRKPERKFERVDQKILENFSNVTILDGFVEGPWEHSFSSPCYQTKLKNILMRYKK